MPSRPIDRKGATLTTLHALHDRFRPLLVFTPAHGGPDYLVQSAILAQHASALAERDIVIVLIPASLADTSKTLLQHVTLSAPDQAEARRRYHVASNSFTVILLGKDGGEKLRAHVPLTFEQLRDTIDSMPMRQQEIRERSH